MSIMVNLNICLGLFRPNCVLKPKLLLFIFTHSHHCTQSNKSITSNKPNLHLRSLPLNPSLNPYLHKSSFHIWILRLYRTTDKQRNGENQFAVNLDMKSYAYYFCTRFSLFFRVFVLLNSLYFFLGPMERLMQTANSIRKCNFTNVSIMFLFL